MKSAIFILWITLFTVISTGPKASAAPEPTWTCASPTAEFNFYYAVSNDQISITWDEKNKTSGVSGTGMDFDVIILNPEFSYLKQSWNDESEFTFVPGASGSVKMIAHSPNTGISEGSCSKGISAILGKHFVKLPK